MSIKIASVNCNSFTKEKFTRYKQIAQQENIDIIALQDTNLDYNLENELKNKYLNYQYIGTKGEPNKRKHLGIGFLFKKNIIVEPIFFDNDIKRIGAIICRIRGTHIILTSVYMPAQYDLNLRGTLYGHLDRLIKDAIYKDIPILILGDFNVDIYEGQDDPKKKQIEDWILRNNLVIENTRFNIRRTYQNSTIDYAFSKRTQNTKWKINQIEVSDSFQSDHEEIIIHIVNQDPNKGQPKVPRFQIHNYEDFWKDVKETYKKMELETFQIISKMADNIVNWNKHQDTSLDLSQWKPKYQTFAKIFNSVASHYTNKKKLPPEKQSARIFRIKKIMYNFKRGWTTDKYKIEEYPKYIQETTSILQLYNAEEIIAPIAKLRPNNKEIIIQKTDVIINKIKEKGTSIREQEWKYNNEQFQKRLKESKFLFTVARKKKNSSSLYGVKTETGIAYEPEIIEQKVYQYYTEEFKQNNIPIEIHEEVEKEIRSHPSRQQDINYNINFEELLWKIRQLKGSSPGPDGIDGKSLNACPSWVIILIKQIINNIIKNNFLESNEFYAAYTKLVHKKNDPFDIKNYRPITVSNSLYRIAASIMSYRLQSLMNKTEFFKINQQGFIEGRRTYYSMNIIRRIIEEAKHQQKDCYIVMVDYSNAYGSVNHKKLFHILQQIGMNNNFIQSIQNIYKNFHTFITTEYRNTNTIPIERGIIQGCPMSPGLFNIYTNTITEAFLKKFETKIQEYNLSISLFADDTIIPVIGDKLETQNRLVELESMAETLDLKINDKTEILWIGNDKEKANNQQIVSKNNISIPIKEETIKYVGYKLGKNNSNKETFKQIRYNMKQQYRRLNPNENIPAKLRVRVAESLLIGSSLYLGTQITANSYLQQIENQYSGYIKKILHINPQVNNQYLFDEKTNGGLQIKSIRTKIEEIQVKEIKTFISEYPELMPKREESHHFGYFHTIHQIMENRNIGIRWKGRYIGIQKRKIKTSTREEEKLQTQKITITTKKKEKWGEVQILMESNNTIKTLKYRIKNNREERLEGIAILQGIKSTQENTRNKIQVIVQHKRTKQILNRTRIDPKEIDYDIWKRIKEESNNKGIVIEIHTKNRSQNKRDKKNMNCETEEFLEILERRREEPILYSMKNNSTIYGIHPKDILIEQHKKRNLIQLEETHPISFSLWKNNNLSPQQKLIMWKFIVQGYSIKVKSEKIICHHCKILELKEPIDILHPCNTVYTFNTEKQFLKWKARYNIPEDCLVKFNEIIVDIPREEIIEIEKQRFLASGTITNENWRVLEQYIEDEQNRKEAIFELQDILIKYIEYSHQRLIQGKKEACNNLRARGYENK